MSRSSLLCRGKDSVRILVAERRCDWGKIRLDMIFPRHQLLRGPVEYGREWLTAEWYFCTRRLCLNIPPPRQAARARARRSPLPPLPTLHIVGGAAKCRARGCGHHRAVVATTSTTTSHRPDRHSRRMRVDGVCNACVVVDDTSMFKYNQNVMHLKNEYFFRPPTRVAPLAPRIPSSSGTYRREPKRGPTTSWQIGR